MSEYTEGHVLKKHCNIFLVSYHDACAFGIRLKISSG